MNVRKSLLLFIPLLSCLSCSFHPSGTSSNWQNKTTEEQTAHTTPSKSRNGFITFETKITNITDGDTGDMLFHKLELTFRLAHIDAPETWGKDQPYGEEATNKLKALCENKIVKVRTTGEFDGYGRLIVVLFNRKTGSNLNKELVRQGLAWFYPKYSDDSSYYRLQKEAQSHHRGLWKDSNPIPPWEFRH